MSRVTCAGVPHAPDEEHDQPADPEPGRGGPPLPAGLRPYTRSRQSISTLSTFYLHSTLYLGLRPRHRQRLRPHLLAVRAGLVQVQMVQNI